MLKVIKRIQCYAFNRNARAVSICVSILGNSKWLYGSTLCVQISYSAIISYVIQEIPGHGSRVVVCFLFARSVAGTVGSNPTQGMDV
jgi:hypothetical protein